MRFDMVVKRRNSYLVVIFQNHLMQEDSLVGQQNSDSTADNKLISPCSKLAGAGSGAGVASLDPIPTIHSTIS